jgi:hypothetical protein
MALLLSILLKAENTEATVAVYQVLRRFTPRYQALEAAGAAALSDKDKELLDAVLFICDELQGQRNALAHGSWGASSQAPNSILWCEPSDMAQHAIAALRRETLTGKRPPSDEIADALGVTDIGEEPPERVIEAPGMLPKVHLGSLCGGAPEWSPAGHRIARKSGAGTQHCRLSR